ncbi:hypothetical protein GSI_04817 [Ganoderma sinense ZZ0214-1]|uniref:Uncharacterized protein n=1 Tax=Ganoderma sinense ZZ0214-1 TaxID=1077348 RepID=A0A2G8SG20_9APHY|nr:hypothetical protein GSI_04817 [Ganoderma sinense ZZ0214-1]
MPSSDVVCLYHSSVTPTPQGNFFITGNNPNNDVNLIVPFASEFRVKTLNPPFMQLNRIVGRS